MKEKSITFRPETWADDMINNTMAIHKIKKKSRAIHYLLKETEKLRLENKALKENNGHNGHTLESENNGLEPENKALNGDHFPCNLLCVKFKECTSQALYYLSEIDTLNCFIPNYPRYCHFLLWENPHGDPKNPYPKCLDPKPPITIPKDRIVTNPQVCWRCMKIKKDMKEAKMYGKNVRSDPFKGQPRINYGKSEGLPPNYDPYFP